MLRRFRYARGCFALAGALACTGAFEARAQAQPLVERFDPAERGSRFTVADSLELDGDLRFTTGATLSYGSRLRTFRQVGDSEASRLIEHSFWIHPGASLVLAPGARFGLDVPVALQSGRGVSLGGTFFPEPSSPAFGDVRASFDLRVAGRERSDVDGAVLAVGVSAYLPTGASSAYASDDFARVAFRVATSVQEGPLLLAARAGYMYRKDTLDPVGGVRLGSEANGVLALGYHYGALVVGPELYGSTTLKDVFERRSTPVEVLGALHVKVGAVQLGAGVGTAVVTGLGAPRVRGVFSLEWSPTSDAPRDRDRDGVIDDDDMCPDVPGLANAPLGARGCPAPPLDGDGDGIIDGDDACPQLPGIRTKDPMTHGCPDADHDGVPDPLDACPSAPGERSVLPRFNGCPPDADGDGVPDDRDACPDEPGVASDDPDQNGCTPPPPPPPDRDADGITDADDACPDAAGPTSTIPDASGCPLERPEGASTLQLGFTPGASAAAPPTLMAESARLVAKQAAALVAFPDVHVLVVVLPVKGARTDPRRAQQQQRLVVDRLVALGVAKERFDARRATTAAAKKKQLEMRVLPDGTR